ncbi:hypothetical protein SS7213T_10029 [Staphylococcus simiae CCM 7213 = CCUG 51256]|uniref:Uncharacterized protein n=1 Tax=Staphylococcus simiae CCM 7213 = CCUG 51256 TaxID=911238 RepID=G5JKI5_9STAP|nr:hypothetical protein SS7213T_10029 [Staphylococcus simiae CCM 7213 = CCUG 51256]
MKMLKFYNRIGKIPNQLGNSLILIFCEKIYNLVKGKKHLDELNN